MTNVFFQNELKFIIGHDYETLNIDDRCSYDEYIGRDKEKIDEYGIIRNNSIKHVGKYIKSIRTGYHDNSTRHDYFQLNDEEIVITLSYDGSTRYREILK